ncbi:MAG: hypothetical protein IH940_00950 [Acidobacteria bacterium]|nr:hypothetical protein [Acidobacteriota bacterium]
MNLPGSPRCRQVAPLLAASLDDPSTLDSVALNHVEHCLRCQAERAQLRRVRSAMSAMRDQPSVSIGSPSWSELINSVDMALAQPHRRTRRVGVCVAAAAAGAVAGAVVYRRSASVNH